MARGEKVWINGEIKDHNDSKISIFTHALHYGTGGFEGIRVYEAPNGKSNVFQLKAHIERLFYTAKILGMKIPYSHSQLTNACIEVVKANGFKECYIRPIFFVGDGPLGINIGEEPPITMAILTWEWGKYLGEEGAKKGVRLKISSYTRPHVNSIMTKGKITGQYVTGVLAKREAVSLGFDEALFLDPEGYLTEGSGENLFMVRKGVIKTTPLTSVLGGITRESMIKALQELNYIVEERRFSRDELYCADEVFLTGTAAEITPVREIDKRVIGEGTPGPITLKIKDLFQDIIHGKGPAFVKDWLYPIN